MQFLVLIRGNEAPIGPPAMEIGLVKETFEYFAAGKDPRIKAVYPFAGERATALLVEASSAEEIQDLTAALPFSRLVKAEYHIVGTVQGQLNLLNTVQKRLASLSPAGASQN